MLSALSFGNENIRDKVLSFSALAPVAIMGESSQSIFEVASRRWEDFYWHCKLTNMYEVKPVAEILKQAKDFCKDSWMQPLCAQFDEALRPSNDKPFNDPVSVNINNRRPHEGGSTKELVHFAQLRKAGKF